MSTAPVVWFVQQVFWVGQRPPIWQSMDPTYTYLVSSIETIQGLPAAHYHHPGFPVYWFLGPILRLANWISGGPDLSLALVTRTEFLFDVSSGALAALQSVALVVASVVLARRLSLTSALLFQALVFASGVLTSDVGPIGMQVTLSLFLIGLVAPLFVDRETTIKGSREFLIASVIALAILTKLTSLPLLFFVAPLVQFRQFIRITLMALAVAGVGTLVAVRENVIDMAVFFANVLPTTGRRPGESTGSLLPGIAAIPSNLSAIGMELLLLLAAVALIMSRSPQAPFKRRPTHVIAGSALALGIAGLSSIKAFKVDDLVVLLVLISSLVSVAYQFTVTSIRVVDRRWIKIPTLTLSALLIAIALSQAQWTERHVPLSSPQTTASNYLEERLIEGSPTLTTPSIPSPATALFFGLWFSQRSFASELVNVYPGYFEYRVQSSRIYRFDASGEVEITCEELRNLAASGDLEFIPGRDDLTIPIGQPQYEAIELELRENIGGWDVYRVANVSCS